LFLKKGTGYFFCEKGAGIIPPEEMQEIFCRDLIYQAHKEKKQERSFVGA
jgi:hypothetical protein